MHFAFTKYGTKIQVFMSRFFPCHLEDFLKSADIYKKGKSADIYKKRKLEKWNSPCSVYSLQHLSTFFLTISKETHLSVEMDAFGFLFRTFTVREHPISFVFVFLFNRSKKNFDRSQKRYQFLRLWTYKKK